ncbi:hypothetical protein [Halorubrum ezzemoulense]|nr:hypothetical protein [Halorubrum ezzemoulense]MDB9288904.1 hypothetical protein [Halorubrum ezzemoulense]
MSVVERMDEMTRLQRVVLLKLEDYWSEKLSDTPNSTGDIPSNPRGL